MTYSTALEALADPTRRAVFERLRRGPQPVGEIAAALPVSRPAVSQHLRVLEGAGLVRARAEGTRRIYSVEVKGLEELRRYLDGFWGDVLEAFRAEAERELPPPRKTKTTTARARSGGGERSRHGKRS